MTAANRNGSLGREVANPLIDPIQAEEAPPRREALSTNIGSLGIKRIREWRYVQVDQFWVADDSDTNEDNVPGPGRSPVG